MSESGLSNWKVEKGGVEAHHFISLEPSPDASAEPFHALIAGVNLRSGDQCPQCRVGRMDYDGLLNLTCPRCGFSPGGGCFS